MFDTEVVHSSVELTIVEPCDPPAIKVEVAPVLAVDEPPSLPVERSAISVQELPFQASVKA